MGPGEQLHDGRTRTSREMARPKPTVLFVDDEAHVISGLRRFMRSRRDTWTSKFACGGANAVEILNHSDVDLVVTDMRMPGIDGAALLEWISNQQPGTIRFVLSGEANIDETYRIVGRSHQFLGKPCTPEKLSQTIASTLAGRWAADEAVGCDTTSFLDRLTTHAAVYEALLDCVKDPGATPSDAAQIIANDPGLSARILQLVNSAYFGRPVETASIERALQVLGIDHLRALVERGRLGQLSACAKGQNTGVRWDAIFGPLAASARAYGATKTENHEVLDTIYATALFSGLGSIIADVPGNAPVAPAAFMAVLLGFPRKLTAALGTLKQLHPDANAADLIEPICASVFETFAEADGGQSHA